jgi:formate dehydrogenase maturation protein FdhE
MVYIGGSLMLTMANNRTTTMVRVSLETKSTLDRKKLVREESYDSVIQRLIETAKGKNEPQAAKLGGSTA